MLNRALSRSNIVLVIILVYLLPFVGLSLYSSVVSTRHASWNILSLGLFLMCGGSALLFWLLSYWGSTLDYSKDKNINRGGSTDGLNPELQVKSSQSSLDEGIKALLEHDLEEARRQIKLLQDDMQAKTQELILQTSDCDRMQQQYEQMSQEFGNNKRELFEQLHQEKDVIEHLRETLSEKNKIIEGQLRLIAQLEEKVNDLTYEIKTLLHLAETEVPSKSKQGLSSSSAPAKKMHVNEYSYNTGGKLEDDDSVSVVEKQIASSEEASFQLKRCLDIAQKIAGPALFENARFRDIPIANFALDLRRLSDILRSENSCTILLYSPNENRLLFVNNQVRALLGWSSEKFIQNFHDVLQDSIHEWKNGMATLTMKMEASMNLLMKNKTGQDVLVHCHLGMVPTGIFRYHVIGVLYSPSISHLHAFSKSM